VARPKKTVVVSGQAVVAITCPACQSKVSSDGSTLHGRSKYLDELLDKAAGLDEIDKAADALERKNDELKAEVLRLQGELEKAKKEKESASHVQPDKDRESKRDGWW